jgi:ABC-type amino acid transport substrate-binding protein
MARVINMASTAKKRAKRAAIVTAAAFSIAMQAPAEQAALQAAMDDMKQDGEHAIIVDMWDDFGGLIA